MEGQRMAGEDLGNILPDLHLKEESPEEQARIDELVAHNPAEDVVDLGKLEDLEKIPDRLESAPAATAVNASSVVDKNKLLIMKKIAQNLKDSAGQLVELLAIVADEEVGLKTVQAANKPAISKESMENEGNVVEGMFDGEKMVGPDGKAYDVPVNYASKSRLVEGDLMKLIITNSGTFIFKQIKPIERRRVVGVLEESETGEFFAVSDGRRWRVLNASVSYFKGEPGDEVAIIVPREGFSRWAAVENVIKR